jgi:hypothetical protein
VHRLLARLEDDGVAGLPVGPEPSAVLANAVLGSADRSLRSQGYAFARWCDDVVVRTASGDVAAVHEAWAAALHPLGLRPAPEKSRVVEPGELLRASRPGHVARRPLAGEPDLPGKGTPAGCVGRRSPSARIVRSLCERAAGAAEGPDPHLARVELARVAMLGERHARAALRHARSRAPYLRATVDWGLRR